MATRKKNPSRLQPPPTTPPPPPASAKNDHIDLAMLEVLRARGVAPEQAWAAYRNRALDSSLAGHLQFLLVGKSCTYLNPPKSYPADTEYGMGWRYLFDGFVDLETGAIGGDSVLVELERAEERWIAAQERYLLARGWKKSPELGETHCWVAPYSGVGGALGHVIAVHRQRAREIQAPAPPEPDGTNDSPVDPE